MRREFKTNLFPCPGQVSALVDWGVVAGADAGGAGVGAISGAWSAVQSGAASASLTFGPQGAVITITGSAISGAVTYGASASVVAATTQWGAS